MRIAPILVAGILLASLCGAAASAQRTAAQSQADIEGILDLTRGYLWQMDDYYWHQGQYERCIAVLRLITQVAPDDVEAYGGGAWLMQNQLRDDEAEVFLLEGIRNNPDVYDVYFEMGYFCYMHERFPEAVAYLEQATRFECPPRTWHMLAHSYELSGDIASALDTWAYCEEIEPDNLVPTLQIDRIVQGGPPANGPALARQGREERMREKLEHPDDP